MEKTGSYGKDGQLWKRRAVMEKTGMKYLDKKDFKYVLHNISLAESLGRTEEQIIELK